MLSKAAKICDWIEAGVMVPEGPRVRDYVVLLPFQRDSIYQSLPIIMGSRPTPRLATRA